MSDIRVMPGERSDLDPYEIVASFARMVDPDQAWEEVLRLVTQWFGADCGQILITDPGSGEPRVRAASLPNADAASFSMTILREALRHDRLICIPDAKQHPLYRTVDSVMGSVGRVLSVIVVPLRNDCDQPMGALYLQRRQDHRGAFRENGELADLARLMGVLSPVLFQQEQQRILNSVHVGRATAILQEMGYVAGRSPRMERDIYARLEKYARTNLTICLQGETGTGKEVLARLIHRLSPYAKGPFIRVPCNAIPSGLAESEFFGHTKGAYSDACTDRPGYFALADGGTLFLDEVSKLPYDVQPKLLHALERDGKIETRFFKVGGSRETSVRIRVVAASNENLQEMVSAGRLREDLYHRLNQLPLLVPPLRSRREDIVPLAQAFLEKANEVHGRRVGMAPGTFDALRSHEWPGNIRELENCVRRAVLLRDDDRPLAPSDLWEGIGKDGMPDGTRSRVQLPEHAVPFRELAKRERLSVVVAAVKEHGGVRKAARSLGISHQTVYNYLRQAREEAPGDP